MKRVRHKKQQFKNVDLMIPIKFEDLGSDKDPCFGKHFCIKAEECGKCGDSEVCAAITANKLHTQIDKQAKKHAFKDVEEAELIDSQNQKMGTEMVRKAKKFDKWLSIEKLVPKFRVEFNLTEKDDVIIRQRVIKAAEDAGLKLSKNQTKYRK